MAATDVRKTYESARWAYYTLTNDGTDESTAVKKVDISTLAAGPNGSTPTSLAVYEVVWDISGFAYVKLLWDADADDEIITMGGSGAVSYESQGGKDDAGSTGATGDLMVQTSGTGAGNTYHIEIKLKKKD